MAFNPYGPAYFIGSGLANLPQNMQNNEARQIGLNMQRLGLQRAQDEFADLQAQNQAYSEPLQVPTEAVNSPEFNDYLKRQRIQQAVPKGTVIPSLAGTPAQMGDIVPPEPEQKQIQRPMDLTNKPSLRASLIYQQAAQRFREMGRGRAALAAEEMSNKYHQQHLVEGYGQIGRRMLAGDYQGAVGAMNDMGMQNIKSIAQAGQDQMGRPFYRVTRDENGQEMETTVPLDMFMAMASGDINRANAALQNSQWHSAQYKAKVDAEAGKNQRNQENWYYRGLLADDKLANNLEVQKLRNQGMVSKYGASGSRDPAKVYTWKYAEQMVRNQNPGADEATIQRLTAQHPLVAHANEAVTAKQRASLAGGMAMRIVSGNNGEIPAVGTPAREAYDKFMSVAMGGAQAPGGGTGGTKLNVVTESTNPKYPVGTRTPAAVGRHSKLGVTVGPAND